ncbi:MAG: hypothetical protein IPQ02_01375 [Saprospiraceae bacterium]|nr:hypothetical protein [Candidatus Defluviibacterium haderslevense]
MAQKDLSIDFKFKYQQQELVKERWYIGSNQDSIRFETLKFYISDLKVYFKDGKNFLEQNSFHLLDFENSESIHILLKNISNDNLSHISFNLGIDSTTNVSGAMGGDLDPTKGMYWTWQNGYINFKLEGKSTMCKTRNNEFQFHIGGYMNPFNTLQKIELPINKVGSYTIVFDLEQLMDKIDLSILNHVMSPQLDAVEISKKIATAFSIE